MAITGTYTWRGAVMPAAYVRVDSISGGKRVGQITPDMPEVGYWSAIVGVYADSAQTIPIITMPLTVPFDTEVSPYDPLYAALKGMAEFEDFID